MITKILNKQDCMDLLVNLEDRGISINNMLAKLVIAKEVPEEVIKFIVQNNGLDISNFYESLRNKHNKHNSPVYTNLLKDEIETEECSIVLSSLLTQISLFGKTATNAGEFYKAARTSEILTALQDIYELNSFEKAKKLIRLVKTDILVLEYFLGRREIE